VTTPCRGLFRQWRCFAAESLREAAQVDCREKATACIFLLDPPRPTFLRGAFADQILLSRLPPSSPLPPFPPSTQAWRRLHKKLNVETQAKRRARRIVKNVRAPVGTTVEKLASLRKAAGTAAAKPSTGPVKQAAVKEAKEKAKKDAAARKASKPAPSKAAPVAKSHGGKGR
jgi:hypothetical protein